MGAFQIEEILFYNSICFLPFCQLSTYYMTLCLILTSSTEHCKLFSDKSKHMMATGYPLSSLAATASKNSSKILKHDQPFLNPILSQAVLFLMFPYLNLEISFCSSLLSLLQFLSISWFTCKQQRKINLWGLLKPLHFYAFLKTRMQKKKLTFFKIRKYVSV